GRTRIRRQGEQWQEAPNFLDTLAPQGDFLAFLVAAGEVTTGTAGQAADEAGQTAATRYSYQIDAAAFAAWLRDRLQAQMASQGELPPGVAVEIPQLVREMRGQGELWLDEAGYPLRQAVHLAFPPAGGRRVEADVTVHFAFDQAKPGALSLDALRGFVPAVRRGLLLATALSLAAGAALLMVRPSPSRLVYRVVTLTFILSTTFGPLLQGGAAEASYQRRSARQTQQEQVQSQVELRREIAATQQEQGAADLARTSPDSLAAIQGDDGRDGDGDGLSDVQERFLGTNPFWPDAAELAGRPLAENGLDSDLDGLSDYQETLLGTNPLAADTDGDTLTDLQEVEGFAHGGRQWHTNPLELDSNFDGVDDSREWNSPELLHPTWDTDGDGIPDLFDEDNDFDGVPDEFDLSPFQRYNADFSRNRPFSLVINGLAAGEPTLVDFQLRPANPNHLWYALNTFDWPADDRGNLSDITNATFPGMDGDVQLLPMLEIQIPGAPSNLPLASPIATVDLVPVPNVQHTFPDISGTLTLEPNGNDLDVTFNLNMLRDLDVRRGTCATPGPVVAQISLPLAGLTQTVADVSLADWADGQHIIVVSEFDPRRIVSCGQIPHLAFEGNAMIDSSRLEPYQISVREGNTSRTTKAVYVPLSLVTDQESGRRVAFNGRMVYFPGGNWQGAHQVRFVWAVSMLVDEVCLYGNLLPGEGESCHQQANDVPEIVHVYDDTWQLTGLNVTEERNVEVAFVYEDPVLDPDLNGDDVLIRLSHGLDLAYLQGRDCDTVVNEGVCQGDGQRDVTPAEIHRRFNHPTNQFVSLEERWQLDNILRVEQQSYDTLGELFRGVAEGDLDPILDDFAPYWSATTPITPSVLLAYDYHFRALNLDSQSLADGTVVSDNFSSLTVNFSANGGVPATTMATLKLSPYAYDDSDGAWFRLAAEDLWELAGARYAGDFAGEPDPEVARGMLAGVQLYHLALFHGVQRIVQIGNVVLSAYSEPDSATAERLAQVAAGITGRFIAQTIFVGNALATATGFWARLGQIFGQGLLAPFRALGARIGQLRADLLALRPGAIALTVILIVVILIVLAALIVLIVFAALQDTGPGAFALGILFVILGILVVIIGVVLPILTGIQLISQLFGLSAAAVETLRSTRVASGLTNSFASTLAAGIGALIELGVIWGYFAYQVISGNVDTNSPEFSQLLAFSLASSLVAIYFGIIAAIPFLGILVGLVAAFDLIVLGLCKLNLAGALQNFQGMGCFGIRNYITQQLAQLLYSGDIIFDFNRRPDSINIQSLNLGLVNPEMGLVAGNQVVFTATMRTVLEASTPDAPVINDYSQANIRSTGILYQLQSFPAELTVARNNNPIGWSFIQTGQVNFRDFFGFDAGTVNLYRGIPPEQTLHSDAITLQQAGINVTLPLYLNTALAIPAWSCAASYFCNSFTENVSNSQPLGNQIFFDILPATLEAFTAMNWSPGLLALQRDLDGDGLLPAPLGNDPSDLFWDSDGDGLADGFEIAYQGLGQANGGGLMRPNNGDSDGDGLCDGDELRFGSNPGRADTDGDGLSDGEEVYRQDLCDMDGDGDPFEWIGGWLFTYGTGQATRVSSDPSQRDVDGDGMSDQTEMILHQLDPVAFPFNPNVFNVAPIGIYPQTSDADNVVLPGTNLVYTATVRNNFGVPLYAGGTLTTTFPAALGSGVLSNTFFLFQGDQASFSAPLAAGAGSQIVAIDNQALAEAISSSQYTVPPGAFFELAESLPFTIDDDPPTSTLTSGAYVQAGGFRVIGGAALDPTSYIQRVEISLDGGASFTDTVGAEAWAFTWEVPAGEGPYTL
ncbi:MAG: hypothetical protein L0331_33450, partial [Chloroflexi bacterium]|nr:hypothetical protein [Chloroflexota bacterium]